MAISPRYRILLPPLVLLFLLFVALLFPLRASPPLSVGPGRFPDAHEQPAKDWKKQVFHLSQDYPKTRPPAFAEPWRDIGFTKESHHAQMLSTFVTYEPDFQEEGPLVVKSRRFAFEKDEPPVGGLPPLIFKNPKEVQRNIVVNVWNSPFADLLDLLGGPDKHNWPRPSNDRSFRSFFNLCKSPGRKFGELPILTRDDRKAASFQEHAGLPDKNVACPTGRYPAIEF